MKGIIWYKHIAAGKERLRQIIKNYERMGIKPVQCKESIECLYVDFENGDNWITARAGNHNKGQRCNISYIERSIDYNIYKTIIAPCTSAFPFTAFSLYGDGNLHIDDSVPLPF